MSNISPIITGQRLKLIRELLLLTIEEVHIQTRISATTLRRIELGSISAMKNRVETLCYLYAISKEIILSNSSLPNWKTLRRNLLLKHRNNNLLIDSINKKPFQKKAIQFRAMQSAFLNTYKNTKEVKLHLLKTYNWAYTFEEVIMALDSLIIDNLLEEEINSKPRKFRKIRKQNKDIQSIPSLIFIKLEQTLSNKISNSVTPAYEKMAAMLLILKEGEISRNDLYEKVQYGNLYKNHNKSLKILEENDFTERTKNKLTSSKQKYRLTEKGRIFLLELGI